MVYYKIDNGNRMIVWSTTAGVDEQVIDQNQADSNEVVFLEALSPDGRYVIYMKGNDEKQILYDSTTKTSETLTLPAVEGDTGIFVHFSPTGKYLYGLTNGSSGKFFSAWAYQIQTKKLTRVNINAEDNPNSISMSPDDRWLAISTQDGSTNFETSGVVLT